jgi:hypothetical protein
MLSAFLFVSKNLDLRLSTGRPSDCEFIGSGRNSSVFWDDVDNNSSNLEFLSPFSFKNTIGAAVEAGILGEMIKCIARAIEPDSNIMTTIIARPTILAACLDLILPRP